MARAPRLLTAGQSRALDIRAAGEYGMSALVLMENAGRQVADAAMRLYRGRKKIAVFCGKGNNGGDGFVAARHLLLRGMRPHVYLAGKISDVGNEARVNLNILLKLKQNVVEISPVTLSRIKTQSYGLIIDALLGVGLHGPASGLYAGCIDLINSSSAKILSIDIPSGLDATTGTVRGCCVKADTTVTFVARKRGMTISDGPCSCGNVVIADIGLPL